MRHAQPQDLDALEPLLARLRSIPALREKSRGVFYARGRAALHFHEDHTRLYADVRSPQDTDFDRIDVTDDAGREELLRRFEPN